MTSATDRQKADSAAVAVVSGPIASWENTAAVEEVVGMPMDSRPEPEERLPSASQDMGRGEAGLTSAVDMVAEHAGRASPQVLLDSLRFKARMVTGIDIHLFRTLETYSSMDSDSDPTANRLQVSFRESATFTSKTDRESLSDR